LKSRFQKAASQLSDASLNNDGQQAVHKARVKNKVWVKFFLPYFTAKTEGKVR
jgi:hypothetical protein